MGRFAGGNRTATAHLQDLLRSALCAADVKLLGAVATASSVINQRHVPIGRFDELLRLVPRSGAIGIQVAHSGDIASFLFDGADPEVTQRQELACSLLATHGITSTWRFSAGG